MNLEGNWPVMWENQEAGQCRLTRRGLYWDVECVCSIPSKEVLRLVLLGSEQPVSLGIPVPQSNHLVLERKLTAKSLPEPENIRLELWNAFRPLLPAKPEETPEEEPTMKAWENHADDDLEEILEDTIDDTMEDRDEDGADDAEPEAPEDVAEEIAEEIWEDAQENAIEDAIEDELEDTQEDAIDDAVDDAIEDVQEDEPEDETEDDSPEDAVEDVAEEILKDTLEDAAEALSQDPKEGETVQKAEEKPSGQQWTAYDPNAPISGLDNWQELRAVIREDGCLFLGHSSPISSDD